MTRDDIFKNAIALIKTGKKAEAQKLLEPYIEANLQDVNAWLLEVETWPSLEKKIKVLEMCLAHNPGNEQVLMVLNTQQTGASKAHAENPTMAGELVKIEQKTVFSFLLDNWIARLLITFVTIHIAISCAFLIVQLDFGNPQSIPILIIAALIGPIVFFPISFTLFPMGLLHILKQIPIIEELNFYSWPWFIYLATFLTIILSLNCRRITFFTFYIILSIILITNVTGCAIMPDIGSL